MEVVTSREAERSKESFDAVADSYDLYRPTPPREVVDAVIALAHLHDGSRVLEVGCGTGQLSVPLAEYGVDLVAVELGRRLAALARRNLERFPKARVETAAFEDWPLPTQKFDAVLAASAFHWLDPNVRLSKAAEALHPGGFLTILHLHHVRGGTVGFFADTQRYYTQWGMSDDPTFQPPAPDDTPTMYPELDEYAAFSSVERRRFEIPMTYSAAIYVGWLTTDSLVNTLDDESRRGFLQDIEKLIESKYHGAVTRNYVYEVVTGQRTS
jgi:SAM-dependent methyltransferase